jgi:asparagine synthase (glutamine-hydrolysing)
VSPVATTWLQAERGTVDKPLLNRIGVSLMCGILAVVDFRNRPLREAEVRRLTDVMVHRGPDDSGVFVDGSVALGHRRLSIIDLTTSGRQPMANEDGSVHVVFNGEIYNYVELRQELRQRGHVFRSSSDTEVIVHLYEEEGDKCVDKLRGMFAFAVWDARKRKLFAARDRFGIKPLYYHHGPDKFLLASEIKAIVADESIPARADMCGLSDYLFAGRALGGKTLFEGIRELEPGHLLTVDHQTGRFEVKQYWDLHYDYNYSRTEAQTNDELFSILDEAIALQCRSDAPLGAHLSDGIDSSAVVAFAASHIERLKTFSIKFSDDPHVDGGRFTRTVARHVGAEFFEASPTANDLADVLPFLIWHMDAPMISDGGFGYLSVSEFARQHVKVCLTGHGGDEVFAGYPAQFRAAYNSTDMFQLYKDPERATRRLGLLERIVHKGPRGLWQALQRKATSGTPTLEDLWVSLHCNGLASENRFVQPTWLRALGGYSPRDEYVAPLRNANGADTLDKCLYHDLRVYLPALLQKEDRVSMAVSIESRVPLLDDRLVEFLATVPPEQKVKGLQPKYLLRHASARLLPDEVMQNREKRGFPVPGSFWKAPSVTDTVRKILLSEESLARGVFSRQGLHDASENVTWFWPLVNVELWFRIFIDKDPYWISKARESSDAVVGC